MSSHNSTFDGTAREFLHGLFRGTQFKATVAILYVCIAGSLWKCLEFTPELLERLREGLAPVFPFPAYLEFFLGSYRIFGAFMLFGVVPMLIVKFIFREKLRDYGLQWGNGPLTVRSLLIMLPIMVVIAYFTGKNPLFLQIYPLNRTLEVGRDFGLFPIHAFFYLFYYFGWEFLFRGFLIKATESQIGPFNAILLQTLASTMMHFGHPMSEIFGAIAAGLFWGFLFYRTKSLASGFFQHSFLGIFLDYFLLYRS